MWVFGPIADLPCGRTGLWNGHSSGNRHCLPSGMPFADTCNKIQTIRFITPCICSSMLRKPASLLYLQVQKKNLRPAGPGCVIVHEGDVHLVSSER